jgi:hypothetical protein
MEARDRAPDGIEPILGYRAWIYALPGFRAHLYPIGSFERATGPRHPTGRSCQAASTTGATQATSSR